jgi:hypothetical protein
VALCFCLLACVGALPLLESTSDIGLCDLAPRIG